LIKAIFLTAIFCLLSVSCTDWLDSDQRMISAAKDGNKVQVEKLLKKGINIDAREKNGHLSIMEYTALMWAAANGHQDVVDILLRYKADFEAEDHSGRTAIMMAASNGYLNICEQLHGAGADIFKKDDSVGTALISAAAGGHADIVRWLVDKGGNVNNADNSGNNALMAASLRGHSQVVKLLIKAGGAVDQRNDMEDTALTLAARGQLREGGAHAETIQVLLDHGSDIDAVNSRGFTALLTALDKNSLKVARTLLEHGAGCDIPIQTLDGELMTALDIARKNGHEDMVKILMENNCPGANK
jgi:ankyrin repeat protein